MNIHNNFNADKKEFMRGKKLVQKRKGRPLTIFIDKLVSRYVTIRYEN